MKRWNLYTTKEIKPKGWLERQLKIQAMGLSGNLDKVWPDVRDSAWIGGDREGWERVPYWLDGFIPLAYLLEDEDMIARAKKYIDAIVGYQKTDGWICPCADDRRPFYDTWAVLLITKVLTVYYDCSGDERIPGVIYRTLKNYYELLHDGVVKLFEWGCFRWYEGFIAISFMYNRCGEDWLLELARILHEQGANYNDFIELWKNSPSEWRFDTHIVNIAMCLKAEAVYCELFGGEYTDNAQYLVDILSEYNGTPLGLFTGDECLSGLSPIHGTELCAVVEQMYSYELLYAYTGDRKWAERLEVLAFNGLPATISDDMWAHQYDQLSNQIACVRFEGKPIFKTNNGEAHLFGLEPNYGCCTANFNQGWPKFALSAFMYSGDTVISSVILPSELNDGGRHIVAETNYPFENSVKYTVTAEKDFRFEVRIPSFAVNLTVNGEAAGIADLAFDIKAGETTEITVSFDTVPYLEARPYDLNTVKCGSLVFSVPIKYSRRMYEYDRSDANRRFPYCDYEYIPESEWNYGYTGDDMQIVCKGVDAVPFSSERPPVVIKTGVKKINWGLLEGYDTVCAKEPLSREPISDTEEIELYPYGCAKLRMTELPIVK